MPLAYSPNRPVIARRDVLDEAERPKASHILNSEFGMGVVALSMRALELLMTYRLSERRHHAHCAEQVEVDA